MRPPTRTCGRMFMSANSPRKTSSQSRRRLPRPLPTRSQLPCRRRSRSDLQSCPPPVSKPTKTCCWPDNCTTGATGRPCGMRKRIYGRPLSSIRRLVRPMCCWPGYISPCSIPVRQPCRKSSRAGSRPLKRRCRWTRTMRRPTRPVLSFCGSTAWKARMRISGKPGNSNPATPTS